MALYRTGTAAMDAQGVITGTGTKWREPLSLIRTGATIVFLTSPLKLAVISDIVSDTEMKAIQTDGEPVENGNYVILLNDSLTVDGMAQDVAETLRYYQSKETVIEEAIEFFKNFDLKTLQDLVNKVNADAQQVANDKAATEQLKNETQQIKDSAVSETQQIKDAAVSETQQIKDSAVAETNQIKADTDAIKNQTQQIKDSAVTEITGIKNEALNARDEAENAQFAAEQSKVGADNAKAGAETARDEARQWAQQVQPENFLYKDQNLNDLADKVEARKVLQVQAVISNDPASHSAPGDYNRFTNPQASYELRISNNGEWRVARNSDNGTSALSVGFGGTGATTVDGARDNLNLGTGNDVGFRGVNAHNWNDSNEYPSGGFLTSILYNTSNGVRAIGRLYSEVPPDGIPKTVIQSTDNAGRNAYMSYDVNGLLQGIGTLSVNSKIRTPTIAVTDRMSVGTPGDDQGLGERSIAIGDHDSGLKQISDGNIVAMADGLEIFRWAPQGLQTDKRITSNYGDTLGQAFYVGGKRTLSNGGLIGGKVEGGVWDQWRDRAAAVMVETDARDAATLIWKAVKWDDVFISGMSTTVDYSNNYQVRTHVGDASFIFAGNSVATAGQWVSTSDIRLKAQLKEIVSAKDKVKVLQGYTYFKRNNLEESEHSFYTEEAGLIAQDVQTVLPEAVYKVADTDYLSINYAGVTALLTNAIKEIIEDNDKQNKIIQSQQDEINELRNEIAEMKTAIAEMQAMFVQIAK